MPLAATATVAPELMGLVRNTARPDATITASASSAVVVRSLGRRIVGWLEEAGLLLLLALAFPLAVLGVGAPVALVVRLLIEIGRRWS